MYLQASGIHATQTPQYDFRGAGPAGSLSEATGVTLEVGRCQDFSRKEGGAHP